jgi:hypothetical protein
MVVLKLHLFMMDYLLINLLLENNYVNKYGIELL